MEEEVFCAKCTEMNEMGAGIVRNGDMVVFVPGMIPGDEAEISVQTREKNYSIGKCLSFICRSPYRIEPRCPDEEACGGCCLGHIPFEMENEVKRNAVRSAFRRAGLREVQPEPVVSGSERYGYRNKISLRYDADRRAFGYCRAGTDEVLPFRGCPLCPDVFSKTALFLNERPDLTAPLRPAALRIRDGSDGITVSFSAEPENKDAVEDTARVLGKAFPDIRAVLADPPGRSEGSAGVVIRDRIAGLDMRFSAEAFRQVNTPVFEKLLAVLLDMASAVPFRRAADLYCGSGIIGLALAKAFPDARITGIEINPDAVEDAKKNAARNGIGNIRFFCGDAASYRRRTGDRERPELITVDPPRAGLSKQMRRELLTLSPERLIYVSCNPQTLARDAKELTDAGYRIDRVVPVNMFPVTKHCETVCCLYHQKKDFISVPYEPKDASYMKTML